MKLKLALASAISLATLAGCSDSTHEPTASSTDDQISLSSDMATVDDSQAPIGKLTDLAEPLLYEVDLTVDPNAVDFYGTVKLSFELRRDATHFWLHGNRLNVSDVQITGNGIEQQGRYEQVLDSGVAKIDFGSELPAGTYTAHITYSAPFDTNLSGLFKVEEQGFTYALAKSESVQARKFLPGFDEPGMKAPFNVTLTVPADYHAITNTPETSRETLENGMQRISFMSTPAMPTYLLSLSVGPFDMVEGPTIPASEFRENEIPLRGYARKGRGAELDYILSITPRYIEIFEEQLQSAYPFRKLDIIAAPAWPSGATELSAAITYRESRILLGENPAPAARLGLLEIHAHEIAHMWFGNLVTPTWWDDLWLKEGFSSWMEPVALAEFEPEAGHDIGSVRDAVRAMSMDSLASARAIREPIDRNEDIRNAYDAITYSKSSGVINMMDSYFGPELFRPALGRYVATYAEGRADSPEFYAEISRQSGEPRIIEAFKSFVEQPGLPLLSIDLDADTNTLSIEQSRYAPAGSVIDTEAQQWNIPVCFTFNGVETKCDILTEKTTSWELGEADIQWVLPNKNGAGYYRWTVSPELWTQVINNFDQLNAKEALSLVDSAIAAFNSDTLSGPQLKQLIEASAQSDNRHVVAAPIATLATISDRYMDEAQTAQLDAWVQDIYKPVLAKLADKQDDDSVILKNLLNSYLALSFDDAELRSALEQKAAAFTGYQQNINTSALSTDEYSSALRVAVEDLGIEFSQHLMVFMDEIDDSRFRAAAVSALSASASEAFLATQHAFILDADTESRESFNMLFGGMATDLSPSHWAFAVENFEMIANKIPAQWRRRLPGLGARFCSAEEKADLNALFEQHASLTPGYERALAQTNERIDLCIAGEGQGERLFNAIR